MREFSGQRTRTKLINQPFLLNACDSDRASIAFGLLVFSHSDTTIAGRYFELGTVELPLDLTALPYLFTYLFIHHLSGSWPAGIPRTMMQFFHAIGPVVGRVRTLACLLNCLLIGATFATTGQAQTFEIDNDHTSLVFAVSHSGLSYTYGRFSKCSGQITISETAEVQSLVFAIDAESIDTNNRLRDDHLKGPEFFDVRAFPEIVFRSVKLSSDGDEFTAEGTLEMHGVKKDTTIKLTKIGIGKGPRGKTRAGFFSKFSVKRSDFGIKAMPAVIGNEIAITLSFEGILKPQEEQSGDRDQK